MFHALGIEPRYLVWAIFLSTLLLPSIGNADTYNLYFKKQGGEVTEEVTKSEVNSDSPVPQEKPVADQVKVPAGQAQGQPIIINNNISVLTPASAPNPSSEPEKKMESQSGKEEEREFVTVPEPLSSVKRPRFKFAVAPSVLAYQTFDSDAFYSTRRGVAALGLNFLAGVNATPWLGFDVWLSPYRVKGGEDILFAGTDIEIVPFRLDSGRYDVLELGIIAGAHTNGLRELDPEPWHLGGRFNLNFSESFGLTSAVRVSAKYVTGEAGFMARF